MNGRSPSVPSLIASGRCAVARPSCWRQAIRSISAWRASSWRSCRSRRWRSSRISPPSLLPRIPGLPDDAYVHDGQLTKREVRSATLAALAPYPDALLWDVGAGCGSIAIEWMRAVRGAEAIAFESNAERLRMIGENADRL